ncbi:CHAT domain-containing protein [Micromonospora sp. WMMD998]|uniref:CHAT domain-containing protein n=1 Tax=Micromonospora sp. WMMD998 TaxID=3016092 RepID=UPI002499E045|nr:CHAT domain-containing protein [Micromonospora sp. WMMD998]WFE37618.1 CHAT domain-containing protein [Micromonospora sp. WMMD998]
MEAGRRHTAYEETGRLSDLESAVALFGRVLDHAHNVDVRSAAMNGLGTALWSRYERFGGPGDLDSAIRLFREALAMYPDERTPAIPSIHANLAGVLRLRWRRTGDEADLVESVAEVRAAIAATRAGDPQRAWRLSNLADGLLALSLRHDDSSALAEAVDCIREAVRTAPPGDGLAGMRSNLSEMLRLRYRSTGGRDRALLDEAVEQGRAALAAAPRHPLRPRFEANLALVLLDRYTARRRPADLSEAADLAQKSVDATPEGHPNRTERLLTLSGIRRMEAMRGRPGGRMVELAREAAAATPDGHHLRSDTLLNLGWALAFQAASGDDAAWDQSREVFRRLATDPAVQVRARVTAAWQWANTALNGAGLAEARRAFDLAVTLLSRTVPRQVTHADRERQLASLSGLARDAAACAVQAGDPVDALRLLEHGRGVLLSQALDTRTELTGLRPELAERFVALRAALDRPEGVGFSASADAGPELPGEDRHALAADWDTLIEEIRAQPGFAAFLRPPPADDLIAATAGHGPVVVLNISGLRCDALLIDGGIRVLPLRLTLDEVTQRALRFRGAVAERVDETLEWLRSEVAGPVLDALAPPPGSRLWWVPTGPLTTLPLHAAVADRVVSSYAPTVRSLVTAWRAPPVGPVSDPLVVSMPTTPGLPPLPNVLAETATLPPGRVLTGEDAVRRAVLDALPHHSWAHFACHAVSAADGSADGHLVLQDQLTVADIARLRLDDAAVAYLSACDTGVPHEDLNDEALHVAGAFHIAGFRHVIGTLWSIKDSFAAEVAAGFYARLGAADDAATALHETLRELRTSHGAGLWAPYIHVGP